MDIKDLHHHLDILEAGKASPEQMNESTQLIRQWEHDVKPSQIWVKQNHSDVAADVVEVNPQKNTVTLRIQEFGPSGPWFHRHTRRLNKSFFAKWTRIL